MMEVMAHRFELEAEDCAALKASQGEGGEIAERARMLLALHACGRVFEVAESCFCDPRVVRKWFQRFQNGGIAGLEDRKRSGRPRRVDDDGLVSLLARIDAATGQLTLRQFSRSLGAPTSTIHRTLSAVGLTFNSTARYLWQQLGSETGGWMELKGLAVGSHGQLMVFRYHQTLDAACIARHHARGGVGCCRHGLVGDPVRLFEVSDREHATLCDDEGKPFATTDSWLRGIAGEKTDDLRCLAWRPNSDDFRDLKRFAAGHGNMHVESIRGRKNWARLVNPLFLYEKRGSSRIRPIAKCWWRLTEAALHALPAIQWSPGKERQVRQFSHYSGDYFPRKATSQIDVNDLFESLLVTQEVDPKRLYQEEPDESWESTILGDQRRNTTSSKSQ
jgi:transposase